MQAATDERHFDLIIAGAGLAGLSLAARLVQNGWSKGRNILLVDKDPKKSNDRTWCFWENGEGFFEPIVRARWERMWFRSEEFSRLLHLSPYTYKLIRGIDLYEHCFRSIIGQPGVLFVYAHIDRLFSDGEQGTGIVANGRTYKADRIFNSIPDRKVLQSPGSIRLLQHFKGWWVRTATDVFDQRAGTLMDLRTTQQGGATFFYVLPVAPNEALIEYTVFSEHLLHPDSYDSALRDHLRNSLHIRPYRILEEEFGVIPMTDAEFPAGEGNIINIGSAGGWTKPSTGYTFQFVQQQTRRIAELLGNDDDPRKADAAHPARFKLYDSIFLDVLREHPTRADRIFARLFGRNETHKALRFLDNGTSLKEDLSIIGSLPTLPFLKAAVRRGSKW